MKSKQLITLLLLMILPLFAHEDAEVDSLVRALDAAKSLYKKKMIELEESSSKRWGARQEAILEKEQNRELLEKNRSDLERLYSDIARVREEKLTREGIVSSEQEKLDAAKSNWEQLSAIVMNKKNSATETSAEEFPIDLEKRLAAYSAVDQNYPGERYPGKTLTALIAVRADELKASLFSGVTDQTVVLESGDPEDLRVLQIGQAIAMGMKDTQAYYLNFYGKGSVNPFKWEKVTDPTTAENISSAIASASAKGGEITTFPVDVMQNQQSQEMLSGAKESFKEKAIAFIKAGGFVVIPLGILLFFSLLLILNRFVVYQIKHREGNRFIKKTIQSLEAGKIDEASTIGKKSKSVLGKILVDCLHHREYSRNRAEQRVKELLLTEVPKLEKHLETLAVLAAAAPLLGLLGTVTGMIEMFEAITKFGTGDPRLLAGGISEALVTTEIGLAIAIPVLLIHTFLRNRRNHIQSELEMFAMMILNRLWPAE